MNKMVEMKYCNENAMIRSDGFRFNGFAKPPQLKLKNPSKTIKANRKRYVCMCAVVVILPNAFRFCDMPRISVFQTIAIFVYAMDISVQTPFEPNHFPCQILDKTKEKYVYIYVAKAFRFLFYTFNIASCRFLFGPSISRVNLLLNVMKYGWVGYLSPPIFDQFIWKIPQRMQYAGVLSLHLYTVQWLNSVTHY